MKARSKRPLRKLAFYSAAVIVALIVLSGPRSATTNSRAKEPLIAGTPAAEDTRPSNDGPKKSDGETPKTVPEAFLSTKTFMVLTAAVDLSNEASIIAFEERLNASKGLLSFPEYCYLQGRVYFARQDFPSAARLFRQIVDIHEFIDLHYDVLYYLGISLARLPGDKKEADAALREYLRRSSASDPFFSPTKDALAQLAAPTAVPPAHDRKEARLETSKSHVFQTEPEKVTLDSSISQAHAQKSEAGMSLHLANGTVMLDELGERLLLVHFWASWCVPCAKELPRLVEFIGQKSFQKQSHIKPAFVTVDNFLGEGSNFLKSAGLSVNKLYWDPDMSVLKHLTGAVAVPVTVLYDTRERHVVRIYPQTDWRKRKVRDEMLDLASRYRRSDIAEGEKH